VKTKPDPKLLVAMGDLDKTKDYTPEHKAAANYLRELEEADKKALDFVFNVKPEKS
jgi:hypothetical protein